jgi:hypothetical protein
MRAIAASVNAHVANNIMRLWVYGFMGLWVYGFMGFKIMSSSSVCPNEKDSVQNYRSTLQRQHKRYAAAELAIIASGGK